jgi:site-specific DNA-methyltransferase (adenine-specific)
MLIFVQNQIKMNQLYFGDNLDIMREHILDESVDLIYLDPPFNSKSNYNVLFQEQDGTKSRAQITAFEDTWHWGLESEETYREIVNTGTNKTIELIQALRGFLGQNDMMAYLVMMTIRLMEMHRILKSTGSIYLHCDPTASHYLKLVMDAIFEGKNFRNEIIWHYKKWPSGYRQFQRNHDVILFYSKTNSTDRVYKISYMPRAVSTLKRFGTSTIISGYDEDGSRRPSQTSEEDSPGVPRDDVWDIGRVPPIKQLFPTQKPEALLERIICASSKDDDLILDPFCGCGTTITVAEQLKRNWVGIDITHLAITLIKHRLNSAYEKSLTPYEVIGEPTDINGARALAEQDRYQFQWWALGKVAARPAKDKKKGPDAGIDGHLYFIDDNSGIAKKIIIQVKSGHVQRNVVATLKGDMEREKAVIGAILTLEKPTRPMMKEAFAVGFYEPKYLPGKHYPKVQILTIDELLSGKQLEYPRVAPEITFKKAERKSKRKDSEQGELDI